MKNRIIFASVVLVVWYITSNLPIWRLEVTGMSDGFSLFDEWSTLVNDNYHLPFMVISGPILALVALINPRLLPGTFIIYFCILVCGFLGFTFSPYVALKYGWYVHLVATYLVVYIFGEYLWPGLTDNNK